MKARLATLLLLTLALTSVSFVGCGVTPGRAITMTFHAVGDAADFVTATGWTVHLTEARLVVGPVYALAPGIMTTRADELRQLLSPVAYAHGGHDDYASLQVRAEWLDQTVVDLLAAEPVLLGEAHGTAGSAEYATLHLEPPSAMSELVHGHEAWIAGTATMGTDVIAFEGGLEIPQTALGNVIEGVAIEQDGVVSPAFPTFDDDGDMRVTVHVRGQAANGASLGSPSWLDQAHFERLAVPAAGDVRVLDATTQPYQAWLLAARNADSFSASYQPALGGM